MAAASAPASSLMLDPFLSGSQLSFEDSSNLEVLMGVFNSDTAPLSLKEAILFATTHSTVTDSQLKSLVEAGETPPVVLTFKDLDSSINI